MRAFPADGETLGQFINLDAVRYSLVLARLSHVTTKSVNHCLANVVFVHLPRAVRVTVLLRQIKDYFL